MDRSNLPSTMLQQVQRPACCRGTPSAAMPRISALRRSRGTCALHRRVLPGPSKRERASARLSVLQASLSCMSVAYHGCYVRLECGQCVCKVQMVVQASQSNRAHRHNPRYLRLLRTEEGYARTTRTRYRSRPRRKAETALRSCTPASPCAEAQTPQSPPSRYPRCPQHVADRWRLPCILAVVLLCSSTCCQGQGSGTI